MKTIYLITTPNGHTYVGSTVNPHKARWQQHVSKAKCGGKQPVHLQMRAEGYTTSSFSILEQGEWGIQELKAKEDYWIAKLKPDLNVFKKSGNRGSVYIELTFKELLNRIFVR